MARNVEVEVVTAQSHEDGGTHIPGDADANRGNCGGCLIVPIFIVLAWGVEFCDTFIGGRLEHLGIHPRTLHGFFGIFLSPWLHGNLEHLALNTVTFLGLGSLIALLRGRNFVKTSFLIVLLSGLGTWLIGRSYVHIGASGVLYGYLGYVIGRAWHEQSVGWVSVAIVVGFFYGGLIWGIVPWIYGPQVSWEAHLSGLLSGLLIAYWDSRHGGVPIRQAIQTWKQLS